MSIASRRLLQQVLKLCKQSVGELLGYIRAVNSLKMSDEDFGESRHAASSEPFFYDQSYCSVKEEHGPSYMNRCNGAPCGDSTIQLFKGADCTEYQQLREDVLKNSSGLSYSPSRSVLSHLEFQ